MPRMHGEHKKDYAARQLANALHGSHARVKFEAYTVGPMCECGAFRFPHEPIAHMLCLTSRESNELNEFLKAENPSYLWDGWAGLGTTIRYRRFEA